VRLRRVLRERGPGYALRAGPREVWAKISSALWYYKLFHVGRSFRLDGKAYRYCYRRYNSTWRTERVVEIPVVWEAVRQSRGRRVLEVGNVLEHYFTVRHDRLDLYEQAPGVVNEDVVYYKGGPYDLIVSISTLEHVGWDETPRDSEKVLRAIENLVSITAPGGRILVTLPMAYNPNVDRYLREGRIAFTRRLCLKRVSRDNRWEQVTWPEIENARYDTPFRRINGLVIGIIDVDASGRRVRAESS
jgi:SAM-dependent methyltransferase